VRAQERKSTEGKRDDQRKKEKQLADSKIPQKELFFKVGEKNPSTNSRSKKGKKAGFAGDKKGRATTTPLKIQVLRCGCLAVGLDCKPGVTWAFPKRPLVDWAWQK
jgi:hypothetical protein